MGIGELADRIGSVDIDSSGMSEISSLLADLNRMKGWVSVIEGRATRQLASLETSGQAPPVADVLARSGHSSHRSAEKAGRRAEAYGNVPELEQQRATGHVSDEHADALATASGKLSDEHRAELFDRGEELAQRAAASTPGQFARHLSRLAQSIASDDGVERSEHQRTLATLTHGINDDTGMGWVRADLHPDDYQKFTRKLDAEVTALRKRPEHDGQRFDQVAATALMGLVTSTRAAALPISEVAVLIDLQSVTSGQHLDTTCEYSDGSPLPVETARRHACNADIIPVVLGGNGQPLDVGRAKRHATAAQRTALRSMYRTCAIDGCDTSFDRCEMHHLAEWDRHSGPTDLSNLLPVCTFHHHRAHEGRWRLQLDASTRELNVFLPNGQLHSSCLPDIIAEHNRVA